jgi:hypothetical protein
MLRVLRGKEGARVRVRIEAATWLADRGFGKPGPAPDPDAGDGRITLEAIQAIMSAPSDPHRVYDD